MKKIIFFVTFIMLIILLFAACNDSTSLQQAIDEHQEFIDFIDADGNQWYGFFYDISLFPHRISFRCTQNNISAYAYYKIQAYGDTLSTNIPVPNTYVYFQLPTETRVFTGIREPNFPYDPIYETVYFEQGSMTVDVIDNTTEEIIASLETFFIPPSPSA